MVQPNEQERSLMEALNELVHTPSIEFNRKAQIFSMPLILLLIENCEHPKKELLTLFKMMIKGMDAMEESIQQQEDNESTN